MVLSCSCGSDDIRITDQTYPENGDALEVYECQSCGRTGSLSHDALTNTTTVSGCLVR